MSTLYKPDGYTTVSPYLIVDGADATLASRLPTATSADREAG
jgi:hypothetical protein